LQIKIENDMALVYQREDYSISTDPAKLDIGSIHDFLANSYWAKNIPLDVLKKSIGNCLNYGVFTENAQIGYARVLTDYSTFAYLADVFIIEEHRGKGLSKWLMECILAHPELKNIRTWMLKTHEAHGLYEKYGFSAPEKPETIMEKRVVKNYPD
jgi:GNAT superfamily N-acetyltransferase